MSPSLLPGQRAVPSPDMLLGSAVTDVSLSLRDTVFTGATTLLSQAEEMPGPRGFRSVRVYYKVLGRLAQAHSSSIPQIHSDFP